MKVYLTSDHAGFELKEVLVPYLTERGATVEDMGPHTLEPQDDYPDLIVPLALRVGGERGSFGIAIGGSGQGEAMAANRMHGARAAVFYGGSMEVLRVSREHNDSNILSLGARFITAEQAKDAAWLFLSSPFSNDERHVRRIAKLDQ